MSRKLRCWIQDATCGIALVTPQPAGLEAEVIFRERFGFYYGARHALFGRSDVTVAEIARRTYVTFPTDEIGGEMHKFALARRRRPGPITLRNCAD